MKAMAMEVISSLFTEYKAFVAPVITGVFGAGLWGFLSKLQDRNLTSAKTDELIVKGAASVVGLQQSLMEQLQDDLDRRVQIIKEEHRQQLEHAEQEWGRERHELKQELGEMSQRLKALEDKNTKLEQQNQQLSAAKCENCSPALAVTTG